MILLVGETNYHTGDPARQYSHRYNVSSNGCTDCLVACCCHVCDLVQEFREIELEEDSYGKQSY